MAASSIAEHPLCRLFSLADIRSATGDFSEAHVIGRGGFGKVYKAVIEGCSAIVAVKRLASNSNQGEKEFAMEMETLTKVRHRNLVSLIGYCREEGEMILVYEYVANGTLADHLYKLPADLEPLSWDQCLRICIGAGRGLDYLHSGCSIIHRDVKSTNILLDESFRAKVSDFGLAKHLGGDESVSHVSASMKGSIGYFDPSFLTTGRLTKASDVYAFGVVLLEVLSGRSALDPWMADEGYLCMSMWAQERIRNRKADQIIAPVLRGEISDSCLKTFVGVARRCLFKEPKKRITMTQAVAQLELALEQHERRGTGASRFLFWPFRSRSEASVHEPEPEHGSLAPNRYCYSEIKTMTKSLSDKLGEGGFGSVYKGTLPDGQPAAVKILSDVDTNSQEFINEVANISKTSHVNIVTLFGFCYEGKRRALVYEYMANKSLDKFLGSNGDCVLDTKKLYEIAVGTAKGLEYLHIGCTTRIVHFDIKPQNILLDQDFCPKISDFGLAKLCRKKQSVLSNLRMRGTYGYIAPEVFSRHYGGASHKSDVYSFGMMLIKMAGGDKIVGTEVARSGENYFPDNIYEQVVTDVTNESDETEIRGEERTKRKMLLVGFWCIQTIPAERPSISKVVEMLERNLDSIQIPPKPFLFSTVVPDTNQPNHAREDGVETDVSEDEVESSEEIDDEEDV